MVLHTYEGYIHIQSYEKYVDVRNSYYMGMRVLPDMYATIPRAAGPRPESMECPCCN